MATVVALMGIPSFNVINLRTGRLDTSTYVVLFHNLWPEAIFHIETESLTNFLV